MRKRGEEMIRTSRIHITMSIDGVEHELVDREHGGIYKCCGCALANEKHKCKVTNYWINWGASEQVPCKVLRGIWKEVSK